MKKIIVGIVSIAIFIGCSNCKLESSKVKSVAQPIVEALANYSKKNGIPKSFNDIKDFPYKLTSCSKKSNLDECKVLKNGYFFKHNGDYYSLKFRWIPNKEMLLGYGLFITHNTTDCYYDIYLDGKIRENYSKDVCSLNCHALWKQ